MNGPIRPWRILAGILGLLLVLMPSTPPRAASRGLTIGALAYGTVNWELEVIRREGFDQRHGLQLNVRKLASPQAGRIALQARAVDLIVIDWLWVARERGRGSDFTAVPYSLTHGALVVPPASPIRSIRDLAGKRLGVAGGALDKNWLLLQALAHQKYAIDLAGATRPVFGAPPLLNQQLLQGRLDALLTYWHHAASLEARGYHRLISGGDLLEALGIRPPIPTLGYAFRESLARRTPQTVNAFLQAVLEAKAAICTDATVWRYVAPLTGSGAPPLQAALRKRYCEGRLEHWGEEELHAAARLYRLLRKIGGEPLTGPATELPAGTFWPGFSLP